MVMRPIKLVFYTLIGVLMCAHANPMDGLSDLDRASNQVVIDFGKKMRCLNLEMMSIGGREVDGRVTDFDTSFRATEVLDMNRARELIVDVVSKFITEINSNENVRNYLLNYPCTDRDVMVTIFSAYEGRWPGSIGMVTCRNGSIKYCTDDEPMKPFVTVHRETYDEAVSILGSSKK